VTGRRAWLLSSPLILAIVVTLGWAGFAPLHVTSRDELFEIPKGTFARRMAGDRIEILPSKITLTLGLNDVLLLRNLDDVPQQFGPTIMMPGQSFRLPFEKASSYDFACSAHASGQMTVEVEPEPLWPWQKIRWRWREWRESKKE
jgi:hypothetical protein